MKKIVLFTVISLMLTAPMAGCSVAMTNGIERWAEQLEESMEQLGDDLEEWGEDLGDTLITKHGTVIVRSDNANRQGTIRISKNDRYITRKFPSWDYNSLDVSHSFQVVMCDTVDAIVVRVNEKLNNHLNVRIREGRLIVDLNHVGSISCDDGAKSGYIMLPYNLKLNYIGLSGSSTFQTDLPIDVAKFELDLSGVSSFTAPQVSARTIEIDLSGSSLCNANLNGQQVELDLSGISAMKGQIKSKNLEVDLSGSSRVTAAVSVNNIDADLSGVSQLTLGGKAENMEMDVSGSSHLDTHKMTVSTCRGEMSGVSKAEVNCTGLIVMELTGTSSLTYSGNPKTRFNASKTASVKQR